VDRSGKRVTNNVVDRSADPTPKRVTGGAVNDNLQMTGAAVNCIEGQ
jgi:hypothetical protein